MTQDQYLLAVIFQHSGSALGVQELVGGTVKLGQNLPTFIVRIDLNDLQFHVFPSDDFIKQGRVPTVGEDPIESKCLVEGDGEDGFVEVSMLQLP